MVGGRVVGKVEKGRGRGGGGRGVGREGRGRRGVRRGGCVWAGEALSAAPQRRAERLAALEDPREEVALARDALERHVHRERRAGRARLHLVPAKRRRNGCARPRPHRVGRRHRLASAVLIRVDEHSLAASPSTTRSSRPPVARARACPRRSPRTPAPRRTRPPRDRHEHVHPVRPARLCPASSPSDLEHLGDEQRDLDHLREPRRPRMDRGRHI